MPTITLNLIWAFQQVLGMPRVAAVEHPFGRPFGDVDDKDTQRQVLHSCLSLLDKNLTPGHVEHLPYKWHEDPKQTRWHPPKPAPIIEHMRKRGLL